MRHTKGPWTWDAEDGVIRSATGVVAMGGANDPPSAIDIGEDDARELVRRYNAHDGLVKACEAAYASLHAKAMNCPPDQWSAADQAAYDLLGIEVAKAEAIPDAT